MELDLTNASLPIYEALANETRLAILRELGDKKKSISEIGQKLAISNALMTKHIRKLEEAQLIKTEKGSGQDWKKKYLSLKTDFININFPAKVFPEMNLTSQSVKIGHFTDFKAEPSCGMATKDRLIGALDDPKSFLDQERVDASIIWLNNGFLEYKIPNPLKNGEKIELLEISMEIASEFPISNNYWPSDLSFYLNNHCIGSYTVPGNFSDVRGSLTPQWWIDEFSQYGLLKHLRSNRYDTSLDGEKLTDHNLNEIDLDHSDFFTFKIVAPATAENAGGLTIFGDRWGNYPQDLLFNFYVSE